MAGTILHLILHFFLPFILTTIIWKDKWGRPFLIMAFTVVVDLDHLLAEPIFDTNRCSIGNHPLHSWPAICVYITCLISPDLKIAAYGLLIHMAIDGTYCLSLF